MACTFRKENTPHAGWWAEEGAPESVPYSVPCSCSHSGAQTRAGDVVNPGARRQSRARSGVKRQDCRPGRCVTSEPKEAQSSGYRGLSTMGTKATHVPTRSPGQYPNLPARTATENHLCFLKKINISRRLSQSTGAGQGQEVGATPAVSFVAPSPSPSQGIRPSLPLGVRGLRLPFPLQGDRSCPFCGGDALCSHGGCEPPPATVPRGGRGWRLWSTRRKSLFLFYHQGRNKSPV